MQPESQSVVRCLVSLTVVSGPDTGMTHSFRQPRIMVGRDHRADFVLSDGFVSNRHAEVIVDGEEVIFRDLKSRHGSTVLVNEVSMRLHDREREQQARLIDGAEIQVGSTLVRVTVSAAPVTGRERSLSSTGFKEEEEDGKRFITTAHQPVKTINQTLNTADKRLAVLFRLAGQLNGLTSLDEVLDLIVESTFDAFPATNFFAVTLGAEPDSLSIQQPFMMRTRGELPLPDADEQPILSTSILRRVAETKESVLFVKDSLGTEVTQSILDAKITACMCAPLVGQSSLLGLMQVDTRGRGSLFTRHDLELFNILASNAAFAIERARLTDSIVEMFEGFVSASVNAIEARDPVTAGHSDRVATYTTELAAVVNEIETGRLGEIHFGPDEMTELRYAALLHDFGKIAVREDVLQKGARLPREQMTLIFQRFQTMKELAYRRWLHEHLRKVESGEARADGMALGRIDAQYDRLSQELDEAFEWLHHLSTKGFLEDQEIAQIRKFGARTYQGPSGEAERFLTDYEVENLCIQKGTLNEEEWVEMRSHAALSESYLSQIPWSRELKNIPCIAGAHHEKLDGSGYPKGIMGEAILPQVRMLTISDIFDALTASDRPYRKAATIDRAVQILGWEASDDKLDRDLVEVFGTIVIPRIKSVVPGQK
jgi:HD-GYP domain-containing protein (c-di-GMP phosphodiesterase class II)/pSer/pThr/pTyr-binding forkhead associated (FHA) protein